MDFLKDEQALKCIRNNDRDGLDKINSYHPRIIIEELKNDLENLEWFFKYVVDKEYLFPGAGSYFYTKVNNNKTFDLYKQYGVDACNCHKGCVTNEQWDYLLEIKYITKNQHNEGCA